MSAELAARRTAARAVLRDYTAGAGTADPIDLSIWAARLADMLGHVLAALDDGDQAAEPTWDHSYGLAEAAEEIQGMVAGWHEYGYAPPLPSPECSPIPPLGQRTATAIKSGHDAVKAIDDLARQLYRLREQLVGELHQDSEIRAARVDAMHAENRARARERRYPPEETPGGAS